MKNQLTKAVLVLILSAFAVACGAPPDGGITLEVDCPEWALAPVVGATENSGADVALKFVAGGQDVVCYEPGAEAPDVLIPIELEPNDFDRRNPVYRQMYDGLFDVGLAVE